MPNIPQGAFTPERKNDDVGLEILREKLVMAVALAEYDEQYANIIDHAKNVSQLAPSILKGEIKLLAKNHAKGTKR